MPSPADAGFLDALVALARGGVECVLVGVGGIDFYARDPSHSVETQDLDVFLAPRPGNLREALRALHEAGLAFEAGGEPSVDSTRKTCSRASSSPVPRSRPGTPRAHASI